MRWPLYRRMVQLSVRHLATRLKAPYPTPDTARSMPRELYEFSNEALALAARWPDAHDVHQERLVREIMTVDGVPYEAAFEKMKEMFHFNSNTSNILIIPLHTGLAIAIIGSLGCIPLVFDYHAATACAEFLQVDPEHSIPAGASMASVGQYTWSYMEPLLGTASFSILCLQLLRGAMVNMAYQPYIDFVHSYRANTLADAYPEYNRTIVQDFGRSQPFRGAQFNPVRTD